VNNETSTTATASQVDNAATAGAQSTDAAGTTALPLQTGRTTEPQVIDPAQASTEPVTPVITAGAATGGLTTLTLSPHLNILTPAHGIVSEQSLQAFAQSMGIEPTQFKQLQSPAVAMADVSGARAGVTASDAQLSALLPSMPTPEGKTIDLSQVLPEGVSLQDLQIDLQVMPRRNSSLELASPSTMDVLGMREGSLTVDAVPGLQDTAQTGTGEHSADQGGTMANANTQATPRTDAASATNAAQPAARSMTEHFEKLSAKLATEMAARVHEQFSQGEWKMKFALKPASLGQVDVQLEMRDGKLAAVFQADNPMTQDLLQNGSQRLRDALNQMGLSQSSVWVGDGRGQASQQGDRHSGARGEATSVSQRQATSQEPVQTVSAPRRDSLSQLDFYA
jgi:flagellar hook-length control protein FliK